MHSTATPSQPAQPPRLLSPISPLVPWAPQPSVPTASTSRMAGSARLPGSMPAGPPPAAPRATPHHASQPAQAVAVQGSTPPAPRQLPGSAMAAAEQLHAKRPTGGTVQREAGPAAKQHSGPAAMGQQPAAASGNLCKPSQQPRHSTGTCSQDVIPQLLHSGHAAAPGFQAWPQQQAASATHSTVAAASQHNLHAGTSPQDMDRPTAACSKPPTLQQPCAAACPRSLALSREHVGLTGQQELHGDLLPIPHLQESAGTPVRQVLGTAAAARAAGEQEAEPAEGTLTAAKGAWSAVRQLLAAVATPDEVGQGAGGWPGPQFLLGLQPCQCRMFTVQAGRRCIVELPRFIALTCMRSSRFEDHAAH